MTTGAWHLFLSFSLITPRHKVVRNLQRKILATPSVGKIRKISVRYGKQSKSFKWPDCCWDPETESFRRWSSRRGGPRKTRRRTSAWRGRRPNSPGPSSAPAASPSGWTDSSRSRTWAWKEINLLFSNCICEIHCLAPDGFDLSTVHKLSNKLSAEMGIEHGAARWEARMLSLCYAAPRIKLPQKTDNYIESTKLPVYKFRGYAFPLAYTIKRSQRCDNVHYKNWTHGCWVASCDIFS